ncbi:plasma membrane protein pth11-like protein [Diplodia corticola]|uniref:Plasma membrane protein pth11-like protein n=1 Tax=Diplodia corticola TaxID=236234 RepID=A0A1J9R419_9PEZI|nr:plasma membrane protein pth11-like protein [Diplodia corticola]OJD35321.1 plasma membrane protein pth11-like protein [Diplodia corticola]
MSYVNRESCLAAGIALAVLALLAVSVRIAYRFKANHKLSHVRFLNYLDDIFCLLALIPTIGTAVVLVYGAQVNVLGQHNDASNVQNWITTTTPDLVLLEKFVYMVFVMQPLAIGFIKLSFLFFYRRIFFVYKSFQVVSLILVAITVAWIMAFFFGFTFACGINFATNWASLSEIEQKCGFGFMATVVYSILDAALDFIILILPFPWIWQLQMPTARKFQVCGVFMLGSIAVASALVRMVICIQQSTPSSALEKTTIMGMPPYDILGITSAGIFWTVVETNVALIACCLPILHSLVKPTAFGAAVSRVHGFFSSRSSTRASSKELNKGSCDHLHSIGRREEQTHTHNKSSSFGEKLSHLKKETNNEKPQEPLKAPEPTTPYHTTLSFPQSPPSTNPSIRTSIPARDRAPHELDSTNPLPAPPRRRRR